jgi:hypothetical protein
MSHHACYGVGGGQGKDETSGLPGYGSLSGFFYASQSQFSGGSIPDFHISPLDIFSEALNSKFSMLKISTVREPERLEKHLIRHVGTESTKYCIPLAYEPISKAYELLWHKK